MGKASRAFVLGLALAGLSGLSMAQADSRIAADSKVPLDIEKATRKGTIKQIINSCFYRETLYSLLPDLIDVKPATGTSPTIIEGGDVEQDRQGTATAWTTTQRFYPKKSVEMQFMQSISPTDSVARHFTLDASGTAGWGGDMKTNMRVSLESDVETDFNGENLNVELSLEAALPYFEVSGKGSQVCGSNNWGRNGCHDTPMEVQEVNLVIPADFVPNGAWTNVSTGTETRKTFDFLKYAECVLEAYEK